MTSIVENIPSYYSLMLILALIALVFILILIWRIKKKRLQKLLEI